MSILNVITYIGVGLIVAYFTLAALALFNHPILIKYFKWARKLFWKLFLKRKLLSKLNRAGSNVLSFPMVIYISLNPEPKAIYLNEGWDKLVEKLESKLNEIAEGIKSAIDPVKIKEQQEALIKERSQQWKEHKEKYPESNLSPEDVWRIEQMNKLNHHE
jgi:hypothetical protein